MRNAGHVRNRRRENGERYPPLGNLRQDDEGRVYEVNFCYGDAKCRAKNYRRSRGDNKTEVCPKVESFAVRVARGDKDRPRAVGDSSRRRLCVEKSVPKSVDSGDIYVNDDEGVVRC